MCGELDLFELDQSLEEPFFSERGMSFNRKEAEGRQEVQTPYLGSLVKEAKYLAIDLSNLNLPCHSCLPSTKHH
jgi:hypothetical protein